MLFAANNFLHFQERHLGWSFLQEIWIIISLEEACKKERLFEFLSLFLNQELLFVCLLLVLVWLRKEVLDFIYSWFI